MVLVHEHGDLGEDFILRHIGVSVPPLILLDDLNLFPDFGQLLIDVELRLFGHVTPP